MKYFLGVLAGGAFLGSLAFFGYTPFLKVTQVLNPLGSAAGTTFNSAKVAQVNMSPSTASATTTSLQNTDGSDRWVTDSFVNCTGDSTSKTFLTGTGLAALTLKTATTSVANLGLQGSTAYATNITVSTSTNFTYNASTTPSVAIGTGAVAYLWKAGSYLTFLFNATSSAACTVGVHYLGS